MSLGVPENPIEMGTYEENFWVPPESPLAHMSYPSTTPVQPNQFIGDRW